MSIATRLDVARLLAGRFMWVPPLLVLAACGGAGSGGAGSSVSTAQSTTAQSTTAATQTAASTSATPQATAADYQEALAMWRRPGAKDACMSCHGPDFFDLARVGTSDADIVRRSLNDGATQAEADALVRGVQYLRTQYTLPQENPRSFRPFQPGGAVLAGNSNIARDLAFAGEMATFTPTLAGSRPIRSLADAERARDEFLRIDFDRIKIGVPLPLWSADLNHSAEEGTFNDWIADLPRIPKAERRNEWIALQDAYLQNPTDENFWRVYFAVDEMTTPWNLTPVDERDRWKGERFLTMKFKSALIGQHGMRSLAMGRSDFMRGQMRFNYLTTEEPYRTRYRNVAASVAGSNHNLPDYLPNPWWEVGDIARFGFRPNESVFGRTGFNNSVNLVRDRLPLVGYPQFVVDSIRPDAEISDMVDKTMLSWFMLGLTLDPGLQRIHQSGATIFAEYLHATLQRNDYFIHRLFVEALRKSVSVYSPQGQADDKNIRYIMNLPDFGGFGNHNPTRWYGDDEASVSATVKAQQIAAFKPIAANFFRMSLYLHEQEIDSGRIQPTATTEDMNFKKIYWFFYWAELPGQAEDNALLRRVAAKAKVTLSF